ncbi:hypothetical protein K470DRAFT_209019 [Piedraia hortae CBS 480.64]|uniref:Mediator of RNA polymerase II transcription subunit 18 n=1 Tax=Piedraia hortae CBS 480.64 TaxID=1314780 RepID=A0A6A7C962_9PEZI|nr:hypothetical protein K470DRAFT_209019 [Piedraia hortae CBS 480.64]
MRLQEFSLHSIVPAARVEQVLAILAGISGMQAVRICEQTVLYRQLSPTKGQQRAQYHKLIRDVLNERSSWILRAEDLPVAGNPTVISRSVLVNVAGSTEVVEQYREAGGNYKFVNQYLLQGHRFTHHNLNIRVGQILCTPKEVGKSEPLEAAPPGVDQCSALDPSGAYLFEVSGSVNDNNNSDLTNAVRKELAEFQQKMKGVLDVHAPDRLSMDPRVKQTLV